MSTDDVVRTTTDLWGRPVLDDGQRTGLPGDEAAWPSAPMLVLGDEDVITCAAGIARALSSEYFFTVWLVALDESGWATGTSAELVDMPQRPPHRLELFRRVGPAFEELAPGCSVVVAIASPDGGDRSTRELSWTEALLDAASAYGLPVRGVVAVGAHRARLLHSTART